MHKPAHAESQGLWLGLLGIIIFAMTLPLTRLAVGDESSPQMTGAFVAAGRAAIAGLLSLPFLMLTQARWPELKDVGRLLVVALCIVCGFPLCTSIAMRFVPAVHASVMLGVLPLATALVGALLHRQRPSFGFWLFACLGALLVVGFSLLRAEGPGPNMHWADGLLLLAMACAALGYGMGAQLSTRMRADHVICWALVLSLPVSLPLAVSLWPSGAITPVAWVSFAYLAVCSQWLGFFAWYRGLALGGTVRVSQIQLLQPFFSMLAALPLLGETLDAWTLSCAILVALTVLMGRRMASRSAVNRQGSS
jgi:drug/metabolite transporter (DMT)-like permease